MEYPQYYRFNHPINLMLGLFFAICLTYETNVILRLYWESKFPNFTHLPTFFICTLALLASLYQRRFTLLKPNSNINVVILTLILLFILHETFIQNSLISIKFAILMSVLLIRPDIVSLCKYTAIFGILLSLTVLLQQLLISTLELGDLGRFEIVVAGVELNRANICDYVAPYFWAWLKDVQYITQLICGV